jgi:hypothetical protein
VTGAAYTWFEAKLAAHVIENSFHLQYSDGSGPERKQMDLRRTEVLTKPFARCQALMNGYLRLLPTDS